MIGTARYLLLSLPRSSGIAAVFSRPRLTQLPDAAQSNYALPVLHGPDRLFIGPAADVALRDGARGSTSTTDAAAAAAGAPERQWQSVAVPAAYVLDNGPLHLVAAEDGEQRRIAVAGRSGFAVYAAPTRRWLLFRSVELERDLSCRAACWWRGLLLVAARGAARGADELCWFVPSAGLDATACARHDPLASPAVLLDADSTADRVLIATADGTVRVLLLDPAIAAPAHRSRLATAPLASLCRAQWRVDVPRLWSAPAPAPVPAPAPASGSTGTMTTTLRARAIMGRIVAVAVAQLDVGDTAADAIALGAVRSVDALTDTTRATSAAAPATAASTTTATTTTTSAAAGAGTGAVARDRRLVLLVNIAGRVLAVPLDDGARPPIGHSTAPSIADRAPSSTEPSVAIGRAPAVAAATAAAIVSAAGAGTARRVADGATAAPDTYRVLSADRTVVLATAVETVWAPQCAAEMLVMYCGTAGMVVHLPLFGNTPDGTVDGDDDAAATADPARRIVVAFNPGFYPLCALPVQQRQQLPQWRGDGGGGGRGGERCDACFCRP